MCKWVDFMAGGQWLLLAVVLGACIAAGWLLSSAVEYRHQREGHHDPDP